MAFHWLVYIIPICVTGLQYTLALPPQFQQNDGNASYFGTTPSCPNAEDIAPCTCDCPYPYENLIMSCSGIADEQQLYDIFHSQMPDHYFHVLYLSTSSLETLPEDTFGEAYFQSVDTMGDGKLKSIDPNAFIKSASTLRYLDLDDNQFTTVPFDNLQDYKVLSSLELNHNPVSCVPIIESQTLSTLRLEYTLIDSIPDGALDGLPNLSFFSLKGSNITTFPILVLPSLSHLDLSNTLIDSIPAGALDGLTNLELFIAKHTNIATMPPGVFKSLHHLKKIDMSYNKLAHLEDLQFEGALSDIILNGNQIATLGPDVFKGVHPKYIELKYNQLTTLPEDTWKPLLDAEIRIRLEGNALTCGCEIAWLVLDWHLSYVADARCESGEKLINLDHGFYKNCTETMLDKAGY